MGKVVKLALILSAFCVIAAGSLAYVFLFTLPKIENNQILANEKAIKDVLLKEGKAIAVSPRGYSGPIKMLVGVDKSGQVIGLKIVGQSETPGLGAKIIDPKFLKQFIGKTSRDQLEPKKDIDAITGATISSRAVCQGVKQVLEKSKP